jgi:hypothetical protein
LARALTLLLANQATWTGPLSPTCCLRGAFDTFCVSAECLHGRVSCQTSSLESLGISPITDISIHLFVSLSAVLVFQRTG